MKSWEQNIRKVEPYVPGEQPQEQNIIKLNTNENPYPPSPGVYEVQKSIDVNRFALYPDPSAGKLVRKLEQYYGLEEGQVFVGVGSDDVLAMCFLTFFNDRRRPVLFPDITYSFYDVWADLFRIPYETVPLDDAFRIRPEQYERENGGIVFPNPNAPTGRALSLGEVERIIAANPQSAVIVDEAYVDFGAESAAGLIPKYDNLIVVQTFSKSRSLAGMRIGFAMGNEKLIKCLNDCKYSFNSYTMNRFVIEAGAAIVRDEETFREQTEKIVRTRERVTKELRGLGFQIPESASNFVFASHPAVTAAHLFTWLKERKIYVRWWDKPRIRNHLRITIGTDREMDLLIDALKEYLDSPSCRGEEA